MSNMNPSTHPVTSVNGQTAYAQQGQQSIGRNVQTIMQPHTTTKLVPVPVPMTYTTAPVVHTATAVPELVHMKYCACAECKSQGKGYVRKVAQPAAKPTNVACEKDLCQAAGEAKERMEMSKMDCAAAEGRLVEFQKAVENLKRDAMKAEREAENAIDNLKEIRDSISQVDNILSNAASQEKANIQTKLQQAEMAEEQAQKAAEIAATNVMTQTKHGEKFKIDADKAEEVVVNRTAEYTLTLCRAAAQCETCKWFEDLNSLYKTKFAYACTKCGWSGDFFDVDKHEAACTGDNSKMYSCEFGCGFKADFDVVGQHEAYSCPLRHQLRAPIMVAPQPMMQSQPVQRIYANQPSTQPYAGQPYAGQPYASQPPIYRSGTNIQSMAPQVTVNAPAPAQNRLLAS